ncbi:MAG: hypothetical protein HZY76_07330 [Anaerolineae bacterium]|nr:MAG: hypothetical protein HZY76_07330 [Anaerolineae bacterium]
MKLSDRVLWTLVVIALLGVFVMTVGVFRGMEDHLRSAGAAGGVVALELAFTPARPGPDRCVASRWHRRGAARCGSILCTLPCTPADWRPPAPSLRVTARVDGRAGDAV